MENSLRPTALEIRASRIKWARRLTKDLDRGIVSMHTLYTRLDSEWRERFALNKELYSFSEALLLEENGLELAELADLISIFAEWEEYEWCMVAKSVLNDWCQK